MKKVEKLRMCEGCREDFYNGKNDIGVSECWMLKDAKPVMKRRVHITERPPWKRDPELVLTCYNQNGFVFVRPDQEQ